MSTRLGFSMAGAALLGMFAAAANPAAAQTEKPSKFYINLEAGYARLKAPDWRSGILLNPSDPLNSPRMFGASPDSNGFRVGLTLGTDLGNIVGRQRRTGWRIEAYGSFAQGSTDANATVGSSIVMLVSPFGATNGILYDGPLNERLESRLTDIETGVRLKLPKLGGRMLKIVPYVQLAYSRYQQDYGFEVRRTGAQLSEQSENIITNSLLFGAGANVKLTLADKFHFLVGGSILLDAAFSELNADQTLFPGGGGFPAVINPTYRESDKNIGYRARFSAAAMYSTGRISFGVKLDGDFRSYTPQAVHSTSFGEILGGARPLRLGEDTILNYSVSAVFKVRF